MEEAKTFFMSDPTEIIQLPLLISGSFRDKLVSIDWKLIPGK
jgi:hypothetical protein